MNSRPKNGNAKTAFLSFFFLFIIVVNVTGVSPAPGTYVKRQPPNNFLHADTTKNPVAQYNASASLKTKMLGVWREVEGENATFEIKPYSIYYFEYGTAYKYSMLGSVLNIKFSDYIFTGKVSFVKGTMVIDSKEFGASKYKRVK